MDIVFEEYRPRAVSYVVKFRHQLYGFEFDDLVQEAWLAFDAAHRRYAKSVKSKAHFAALFFKVLRSHMLGLVRKHQSSVQAVPLIGIDEDGEETDLTELLENLDLHNISPETFIALGELPFSISDIANWGDSLDSEPPRESMSVRKTSSERLQEEFGIDVMGMMKEALL